MGCSKSKTSSPVSLSRVDGQLVAPVAPTLLSPAARHSDAWMCKASYEQGKGKGKGKGKRTGTLWQTKLDGKFQDYGTQEDMILKRAYMIGQHNAKFHLRGQNYEYNFSKMIQKNKDSGKERQIRPPLGPRPPTKPLLPKGPMIVITVRAGQPGSLISVKDPNNPGTQVQVYVPAHAKPGQKMAVPIPEKGQSVESVQRKQQEHDAEHGMKTSPWSTGGKVAAGGVAVAGLAAVGVGGVILGDHLAGGDMADSIGEAVVDAGDWAADAAGDVGDWAADAAGDVGDWAADAADDAAPWLEGAGEDIADFAGDAGEWLGDAAEDIGDFVMDLF